jgi:hypothetical protein
MGPKQSKMFKQFVNDSHELLILAHKYAHN